MNSFVHEEFGRLLDRASRRMDIGDVSGACDLVDRVIRDGPANLRARLIHCQALLGLGRAEQALESLDVADLYIRTDGNATDKQLYVRFLIQRSLVLGRLGKIDQVIVTLQQIIDYQPDNKQALEMLGAICLDVGKTHKAIDLLERVLSLYPNDLKAMVNLAEAYQRIDCPEKALEIYSKLEGSHLWIANDSNCENISPNINRLRIARLFHQVGQTSEALDLFDSLMAENKDDPDIACQAAAVAVEMGDDSKAIGYLSGALSATPRHQTAVTMLGEQHMRSGRFAKAGRMWWRAMQIDKNDCRAIAGLIVCGMCLGRDRISERLLRKLSLMANRKQRRSLIGQMWQLATPGVVLENLLHHYQSPGEAEVLPRLLDQASQAIQTQAAEHKDHADLHYHLAVCYQGTGQSDAASHSLDRALHINSGYIDAARMRVELLLGENNLAAGQAVIDSLCALKPDTDKLLDLQLVTLVLQGETEQAIEKLIADDQSPETRQNLADAVTDYLFQYDQHAAQRWIAFTHRYIGQAIDTSDVTDAA